MILGSTTFIYIKMDYRIIDHMNQSASFKKLNLKRPYDWRNQPSNGLPRFATWYVNSEQPEFHSKLHQS